ncbi:MAG: ATP-binding protein, partial [Candidatus Limnocylindria bacterium]
LASAELLAEVVPAVVAHPIVLCLTMRPERSPAAERLEAAVGELPDPARSEVHLQPLDESEERRLAEELLEADTLPDDVRAVVLDRCDGNPLFVEELVGMLVESGSLVRDAGGLRMAATDAAAIPASLHGLLLARVDALPRPLRRLAMVGSVIGRDFPFELARAVALEAGGDAVPATLADVTGDDDLLQIVADRGGDRLVFRHALIHDAAYASLVRADRRRLHGIAGTRLEAQARLDHRLGAMAPTLAHHFAEAGDHEPTLRYALMAGRSAAASYANHEAIDLYALAIEAARALLHDGHDPEAMLGSEAGLSALLEAQAMLLRLPGRYADAEEAFHEALSLASPDDAIRRSGLLIALGAAASDRQAFDEEEGCYLAAEAALGDPPLDHPDAWWQAWIRIRINRAEWAYWLDRTPELEQLIGSVEEPVRLHGTLKQQAGVHGLVVEYLHRKDRYLPSAEVMRHARLEFEALSATGDRGEIAWGHFSFGFALLWNLDLTDAERELTIALTEAEHIGDLLLVARSITYLSITLRRLGRVAETRDAADRTIEVSRRLDIEQYVAIGLANRAWVEFRSGELAAARADAEAAEATWPAQPPLPFHWLDLWVGIATDLAEGRPGDALPRCRQLLDPGQQPPHRDVEDALRAALDASTGGPAHLSDALATALERARDWAYL